MSPYDWIIKQPVTRRSLPPAKLSTRSRTACGNCGLDWVGFRKMCPACYVRIGERTDAA